ncbi:MAG: ribosome biogenesis GTP-binding protein YihA/YsxC [Lachnospiraceae bacterium]|nr:ribosome biogenesis GTP-binding protein YihA/YsxC [Lachnospiraceae bacterium]
MTDFKIKTAELETVCGITSKLPVNTLPEVAFAGKSNVGKSSLINTLVNRKALARTSAQPGKTQTINFYKLNGAIYLVDLPGYGYAKTAMTVREQWGAMVEKYLRTSEALKTVFFLIDIRHEPTGNDCLMYDKIRKSGRKHVIICTKADKISKGAIQKNLKVIREKLNLNKDIVMIPFSSETKQGRDEIYEIMGKIIGGEEAAATSLENGGE